MRRAHWFWLGKRASKPAKEMISQLRWMAMGLKGTSDEFEGHGDHLIRITLVQIWHFLWGLPLGHCDG